MGIIPLDHLGKQIYVFKHCIVVAYKTQHGVVIDFVAPLIAASNSYFLMDFVHLVAVSCGGAGSKTTIGSTSSPISIRWIRAVDAVDLGTSKRISLVLYWPNGQWPCAAYVYLFPKDASRIFDCVILYN